MLKLAALLAYLLALAALDLFRPEWLVVGGTLFFITLVSLWDWRWHRVPNLFTYPTMVVGVFYHALTAGWGKALFSIEGLLLGGALLLIPYMLKWVGAGDVKALAALGAIWGPGAIFQIFLAALLLGGCVGLGFRLMRGGLTATMRRYGLMARMWFWTKRFHYMEPAVAEGNALIPYGMVISGGVVAWYLFVAETFS